jgi:hypothetical protein
LFDIISHFFFFPSSFPSPLPFSPFCRLGNDGKVKDELVEFNKEKLDQVIASLEEAQKSIDAVSF